MIFGIDSHKRTLAACAVDELGRQLDAAEFPNEPAGHRALLAWARAAAPEARRFGLESSGHYAYALARLLLGAGEEVLEVRPGLVDAQRRRARRGKSDALDALAIARVSARGEGLCPVAQDPVARDLKLLSDYRRQLKAERTRTANRLHADLIQLRPGYQGRLPDLAPARLGDARRLLRAERSLQGELARRRIGALARLDTELRECERRLGALVRAADTGLLELSGVGVLVAARIIGEVRDVRRFGDRERFAAANGTAPIPASSGVRQRHRLNRGGNRRLNWAIHLMALTQSSRDPRARAYLARRRAEGRSRRDAMRALKRHLSDVVYRQLVADAKRAETAAALT
jgi:transposase